MAERQEDHHARTAPSCGTHCSKPHGEAMQRYGLHPRLAHMMLKAKAMNLSYEASLLAFAYPDRIAQLRHTNGTTYLLSNSKGAHLHADDTLFNTPYLVVSDLNAKERNATIYDEVKKELRGKYKKHYWPDNPLEAQATSRTKKRM